MTPTTSGSLPPLRIKCSTTDCSHDLHCYRHVRRRGSQTPRFGCCVECSASLVDWPRVHARRLNDVDYTFERLRTEWIRHHFWHLPFPLKAVNYARRKGRIGLHERTARVLAQAIRSPNHPRQGRQTPFNTDNPIHFAQHATATCCRRCLEEWHGIPPDTLLSPETLGYLTTLATHFLDYRLPDLSEQPVSVSRIPRPEPLSSEATR